uniref:Uncharacterized protein n=1 Tax=Klebsiella pneumoniae TaxID=573 RepID=A0A8B0SRZ3_KLEPN|nr:hypothetical protein [Klebsiella pneumoniae]
MHYVVPGDTVKSNAYSSVLRADKHRARRAAKRDIKKTLFLTLQKSFMN